MSVTALLRGKWGQKAQDSPEKHTPTQSQPTQKEEDDEDESAAGFSRGQNPRNSRFYRSIRKKKLAKESRDARTSGVDQSPSCKDDVPFDQVPSLPKSPMLPGASRSLLSPQRHYSTTVLPSNGEASSRHVLYTSDREARRKGVGGRGVDISATTSSQHRDSTEESLKYRTHTFHREEMKKLSDQTAAACTVQEIRQKSMSLQQSGSDGTAQDVASLRLLSNQENSKAVCHSLKFINNVDFLYQEYRDTSKQQEIEQRRKRENIFPMKAEAATPGSVATSPPALQLQLRNNAHSLSLWQNLDAVRASGLLTQLDQKEIFMQEAMFELVTSEASYYKSLETLETHFLRNPVLYNTLSQHDMHFLFSNIEEVMKASERFLMDLEERIEDSICISDVCDIVYYHAEKHFSSVFTKYVINQGYQEKNYRRILEGNQPFRDAMASLEKHSRVRGLSFTSFLILPFQRITRLKLLVQNILKKVEENSERETNAVKAHQQLEKIVKDCNEGVRKMSRTEELISIEKTLEFKSKSVPIISHSRWLLRKGGVQVMSGPKSTKTMRSRKLHQPVYLFLFNNLLLVTKRSGDKFQVLDSCIRSMLRTEDLEDQGQALANVFNLKLLENQDERPVNYMLKASSMSDKLRWMYALTPNRRTRFMSTRAHQPDSLQVQCIQSYSAQEPDELSTEMADVLNLLERTNDGWMMGERLHDGEMGWFPSRVMEEIQSKEVRAQNLREAFKIQQAHEGGTSLQAGARPALGRRRSPKVSNFSSTWTDQ